jgi:hypothetical protein
MKQVEFVDHFLWYISPHMWTSLAADAGASVAMRDQHGGWARITTGAVDNNEAAIISTNEIFLWGADKPADYQAKISFTEIASNAANVAFGVADAMGANLLTDDTGAPSITTCGALIYKVDGGTKWKCYSKNGSTVNDTQSTMTAGGSQRLHIQAQAIDATYMAIMYQVNDTVLVDANGIAIRHLVPYASAGEMKTGVYAKTGGAPTLLVDVDLIGFVTNL